MTIKNRLTTITTLVSDITAIIDQMEALSEVPDPTLNAYRENCLQIPNQIQSGRLKVAVVGVIKSGKSTLINALAGKELVKRGAGVVTAITTRIQRGEKNKARLTLKSWDEVNDTLRKNLEMYAHDPLEKASDPVDLSNFDLRRQRDRELLREIHGKLKLQSPIMEQGINPQTLILEHALEGYAFCSDLVQADETELIYESRSFEKHKLFTANPAHAFFVKDVCLEICGASLSEHIEIADCQGADSTDPAQLSQVIHYLESSNLILYCISSRTGLRQSDMVFLKAIKRMGLFGNIIFVNNCDLSEHDTLKNLKDIEKNIQRELSYLGEIDKVFTFSALMELFELLGKRISKKNASRLAMWQEEGALSQYSRKNVKAFKERLKKVLDSGYFDLLLSNPMERLQLILKNMEAKADLLLSSLSSNQEDRKHACLQAEEWRENANRLKSIVDHSMEGAISGLIKEIEGSLDQFFHRGPDNIMERMNYFIKNFSMDIEPYRPKVQELGFKKILYFMFQDFKRELDLFLLREILPDIKGRVGEQEKRIEKYFKSLLDSYRIDLLKGNPNEDHPIMGEEPLDSEISSQAIKKILGLELPPPLFSPRFTKRMQANAVKGLSLYSIGLFFKSLVKKQTQFSFTPGFFQAAAGIKKESLSAFSDQLDIYQRALKNNYFNHLIDAVTRDFKERIDNRFSTYDSMNENMEQLFALKERQKQEHQEKFCKIKVQINECCQRAASIRE